MCLAYPARVVSIEADGILVENSTGTRKVKGAVSGVKAGDYVLVQQGMAVEKLTRREAEQMENSI